MKNKSIPSLLAALALAIAAPALAASDATAPAGKDDADQEVDIDRTAPPKELAQATVNRILSVLDGRREELKKNPQELYALVDRVITPLIDIDYTAKLVLGPHWRQASPEQRERFTKAFKSMLMRTYADALVQFKEQKIEYLPLEENADGDRATLRAEVQTQGGEKLQVALSLHKVEGKWLVYDATVGSLSLVPNYRVQFTNQISRQGLDAVIERMEEKYVAESDDA